MRLTCDDVREFAAGYVLDALEPAEEEAVREHLLTCPDAHIEYQELGGVVPYLAETIEPVEPPSGLKQRLLAAAATEPQLPALSAAPPAASAPASARPWPIDQPPGSQHLRQPQRPSPRLWLAGMAAALLIAVLGGSTWLLQTELQASRQYEAGIAAVLELATAEGSRTAILSPDQAPGPRGIAAIAPDGRVAVAMRDLAATTGDEVYETWVIAGDSAPQPLGGFRVDSHGTGTLVTGTQAAAQDVIVAITLEPAPGATSPTGPILVSGSATSPSS